MPVAEPIALSDFLRGEVDNTTFRHADHVACAFALLKLVPFPEAVAVYARALKTIAARAGNPGAYHETITVGFLSLVAERMAKRAYADFKTFTEENPDLMKRQALADWYGSGVLESQLARRVFLLPGQRP